MEYKFQKNTSRKAFKFLLRNSISHLNGGFAILWVLIALIIKAFLGYLFLLIPLSWSYFKLSFGRE